MKTSNTSKWSTEELTMLVDMYPNLGARIPNLKRSPRAIQTKAHRLGLKSSNRRVLMVSEEIVDQYYKLWPEDRIARNGNGKEIYNTSGKLLIKHPTILKHIVEEDVNNAIRLKITVEEIQNICLSEGFEPANIFDWELRLSKRSSDRIFLIQNNEVMSVIKTSRIERMSDQFNTTTIAKTIRLGSLFDKTLTLSEILNGIHVKTDKELKAVLTFKNQHIKMRVNDKIRIRLFI